MFQEETKVSIELNHSAQWYKVYISLTNLHACDALASDIMSKYWNIPCMTSSYSKRMQTAHKLQYCHYTVITPLFH